MRPKQLLELIKFSINNKFSILIKGSPGIGKTDIVMQATKDIDADLVISHPVVNDPTDYKGLPFLGGDGVAHFAPFGELNKLIKAEKPTVYFMDDLGQASASVQAAAMQLILSRRINGHKVSDHVIFMAATNRREDKAGVQGILEPVKSRFKSIVELEVSNDDWVKWALDNNMPTELIAFIRYRPELLSKFVPTKDITNTPCPRTVASVGQLFNAGIPSSISEFELFAGAAGEGFASEFCGFLKVFRNLPPIDQIILAPDKTAVPEDPAVLFALTGALGARMNDNTIDSIVTYLDRLPGEMSVVTMRDAIMRDESITNTRGFIRWSEKNQGFFI